MVGVDMKKFSSRYFCRPPHPYIFSKCQKWLNELHFNYGERRGSIDLPVGYRFCNIGFDFVLLGRKLYFCPPLFSSRMQFFCQLGWSNE